LLFAHGLSGAGPAIYMGILLAVACIAAITPVLYVENVFLKSLTFSPYPNRATPGCLLTAGNPIIAVSFVIVIVFETFVLILTLIKGVQHYRLAGNRGFVAVLYRDGVLFYFYLLGFSIVNLLVIITAPRDLADILATLQRVLHSSLSARVLMNLRDARLREIRMDSLSGDTPLQHLTFARTGNNEDDGRGRAELGLDLDQNVIDIRGPDTMHSDTLE